MWRKSSIALLLFGLAAAALEGFNNAVAAADSTPLVGLRLPFLSWPFSLDSTFGWIATSLFIVAGLLGLMVPLEAGSSPQARRQWQRFRSIRRGYVSMILLVAAVLITLLDPLLVGGRALVVSYAGKLHFPAFIVPQLPASTFGAEGEAETDYRDLKSRLAAEGSGWVLMPLVPWHPVLDTDELQRFPVSEREDGLFYRGGQSRPYSGRAYIFYEGTDQKRQDWVFREGRRHKTMEGFATDGSRIEEELWEHGELVSRSVFDAAALEAAHELSPMVMVSHPPIPPSRRHWLGTDSRGGDVLAQLYGGWQLLVQANVLYLLITYILGISIGCAMGYFAGRFDILFQRFIEVLECLPFLYVVMIIAAAMGRPTMPALVGVLCIFSWIGLTYYMRTATLREKARDYVASALAVGASPIRTVFQHILPNTLSIIITFLPFSATSLIGAMTALDYLGFGLPAEYPSWGRLLREGTEYLSSPWIVAGTFFGMMSILILVTFVGEALREAFDPKKFTTYR
jgi:microcin C transport system permease protein